MEFHHGYMGIVDTDENKVNTSCISEATMHQKQIGFLTRLLAGLLVLTAGGVLLCCCCCRCCCPGLQSRLMPCCGQAPADDPSGTITPDERKELLMRRNELSPDGEMTNE